MRPTRTIHAAMAFAVAAVSATCEDPIGPPAGFVGSDEVGQIMMSFGTDPQRFPRDPLVLDSASITGDTLRLHVQHGGGCERHIYALVAWNGWLESDPVQTGVLLAHEDRNDPCDALLFPELRFQLGPMRDAWRRDYGAEHGTVVIRLSNPANPAGPPLKTLSWSF